MALSDEHRDLISKLKPVEIPETPCVECEPDVDGLTIVHAALCPVAICVEDVTVADRIWFQEHPFADYYLRPVTWGEGAELLVHHPEMVKISRSHSLSVHGRVRVERIGDDIRVRKFADVWFAVVERPGLRALRISGITLE